MTFNEHWLERGACVPVDVETTAILLKEIKQLRHDQWPKKQWIGLTDEDELDWEEGGNLQDLVKAIEAKLKEKNT